MERLHSNPTILSSKEKGEILSRDLLRIVGNYFQKPVFIRGGQLFHGALVRLIINNKRKLVNFVFFRGIISVSKLCALIKGGAPRVVSNTAPSVGSVGKVSDKED